nr:MFS transporter [Scopulibacillus daqui]
MKTFISPITQSRDFTFLWLGQLLSVFGSSVTLVILPIIVYSLTGSTVIMGTVMALYMLPNVLVLAFSGIIVDRLNRVKVMMFTDIVRFIIMIAAMVLILTGALTIQILFLFVAVYGLMDGVFQPAYSALRAKVFVPKIRNAANALTQISNQGARLIGPAVGGLIVSTASSGIGFGLDALTYLFSFGCLIFLRHITMNRPETSAAPFHLKKDFTEGISVLKKHPWLWITILAFSFINICYGGATAVLVPWLLNVHYQFKPSAYGLAMTFSGIGAMAAALIFGSKDRWHHRGMIAYSGVLLSGLMLFSMAFISWKPFLVFIMAVEGFGIMFFGLIWETSLQELVPEEAFGRVASLDFLGSFALMPVGYLVIGWSADWLGQISAMILLSVLIILTVIAVLTVPSIRRFD